MNLPLNDNDNNDEKLESFLRQFRPRRPRPLAIDIVKQVRRQRFVRVAWAGPAAAIVIAAVLLCLLFLARQGPRQPGGPDMARNNAPVEFTSQGPLTIATANALLARASSLKAAVDQMANRQEFVSIPKDKHSALAVLSEEEIKL